MIVRSSWIGALVALSLSGCGGDAPTTEGPAATDAVEAAPAGGHEYRDTLVVGYQSDIGYLMPVVYETAADSAILNNIMMPIIDSEFDCSLKKQPGVATSWEWSDDGTVLTMTLRDDLTWEDGNKVTVDDIVFAYELIADPAVASPRINHIEHLEEGSRPKVIDANTIEWHFTHAFDRDTQASHASFGLVPKHVWTDADRATIRGNPMTNKPLANGPFKLSKWDPGQRIVLEPNENFTGPEEWRAHLKRVIFRIIPEYSARLIALETGEIDMMEQLLVEDADRLRKEHPEIRLQRRGWRSNDYIAWNLSLPQFQDKRVRQAIAHAVDMESMIAKILTSETGESYARRSVGTITPALCGVHNDELEPYPYATEQAKTMLADAGWTDTDGDGFVDKAGKRLSFTLTTNTGNKRREKIAVLLQAQLKDVGVEVHIEKLESNKFFDNLRKREYEAALAGWSAGLFIDPTNLWHCETEQQKYEFNFTGYCNPKVDALIEKGLATPNPKDAAPIWKEMQAQIYEDQPYLFLWWMDEIVAIHDRFDNTSIDILSTLNNLQEWEVPPEKVKYKR